MHRLSGAVALIVSVALVASGCGGGNKSSAGAADATDTSGKRGGELTVLSIEDVLTIDPGQAYYAYDYQAVAHPTQRALYAFKPSATRPSPDLAAAMPKTSSDGRTVTVKIKPDIRYSAPLAQRTVKSADVKYAIERTFLPSVQNQYAAAYYGAIVGADAFRSGKAEEISGIQTPDDTTLVLKLENAVGVISNGQSLSLPGTVPVPRDYAQRYDEGSRSTYGAHQVFTGPYMIRNDGKGKITGFKAGRRLELVRNPSWDPKTDHRPAYLDAITFSHGNDIGVASGRILGGKGLASGDFAAPPIDVLRSALSTRRSQLAILPSQGVRFVALNTSIKPFDNADVRRAVAAAIDRDALRRTRGGAQLGSIATHFLPVGLPGFELAGGSAGTFDFMKNPHADLKLARRYMSKAGYAGGSYSGPRLLMVGDDQPPGSTTGEAVRDQLEKLGFELDYRRASPTSALSAACGTRGSRVAICPNGAWGKDFFDAQSMLDPVFNGENLMAGVSGPNLSQVDDPELDAGLEIAAAQTDPRKRAEAYGEIDRTVTGRAYVVPWLWDNQTNLVSDNVKGVVNRFNASWDMAYMSLK
ncbi:MAG: ABC transporter substrate-binding protein [Solirubrobacteraceae bacterium]